MWMLSYDVTLTTDQDGQSEIVRGFFGCMDAEEARLRFECGKAGEPERNWKLEKAHHFEIAMNTQGAIDELKDRCKRLGVV